MARASIGTSSNRFIASTRQGLGSEKEMGEKERVNSKVFLANRARVLRRAEPVHPAELSGVHTRGRGFPLRRRAPPDLVAGFRL